MSGHSKWHNIQGRKNAQDAIRSKNYLVSFIWLLKVAVLTQITTLAYV